jgi:hypothetical protein
VIPSFPLRCYDTVIALSAQLRTILTCQYFEQSILYKVAPNAHSCPTWLFVLIAEEVQAAAAAAAAAAEGGGGKTPK